jgi:peptidoglycan/xylan/chitin deacetylase (PgdA/CDA1 family)
MISKRSLMIHNITEDMFALPLEDYVLTFDDGTEDHYTYYQKFKSVNTLKKYFIIAERIGTDGYLTLEQVKEMMQDPQVSIGGHSYSHTPLGKFKLIDVHYHIISDTEKMIEWFKTNLGFTPEDFCFPYNYDPHGLYKEILKRYGIVSCYGDERIPVETLLQN